MSLESDQNNIDRTFKRLQRFATAAM